MGRPSDHSAEEFGKAPSSGSTYAGLDSSMIGAPTSIMVDALVEQESGKTPTPPPFTVRTAVIVLAVLFVVGVIVAR